MVVSFHELAERELNHAAQYYDLEQPGLGAAFGADVRHCSFITSGPTTISPPLVKRGTKSVAC